MSAEPEAFDYERVDGFVYEDALSAFVFCGGCDGGRCRPVGDDSDEYECADGCGRTYTVQRDDAGVLDQ